MTDDNALLAALRKAADTPPPKDFRPGVTFQGRSAVPSEITTGPLPAMEPNEFDDAVRAEGFPLPETHTLILDRMEMTDNEAAWQRDPADRGKKDSAFTGPTKLWRYKFKVVPKSARHDEDIAVLMAEARDIVVDLTSTGRGNGGTTSKVINLSDFQWGKTDENGGTAETLAASEAALAEVVADLVENPVDEILLVDNGDILEGTESAPNAVGTNDLSTTEQVRLARRIFWRWIEAVSPLAPSVKCIAVPSNHCRVRRGKAPLGDVHDDWGIEVLSQLADIAKVNPEAFGHVEFIVPNHHEEHVILTLVGGQVIGFHHGHHASPAQLALWVKKTGRRGLAQCDIVVVGHHHHLVIEAFGDMQWLVICPTMDPGSGYYTASSGERSERGVLTFSVDVRGWFRLLPVWVGHIR